MNNQEICRFVNSKDIRKYLFDTDYNFSSVEAAWLVYQCQNCTLDERISAWEDIINNMQDQQVDSLHFEKPYESLHDVLRRYIDMEKAILDKFLSSEEKSSYQYSIIYKNGYADSTDPELYSSYELCHKQMLKDIKEDEDDIYYGIICRHVIDGCVENIKSTYNSNGDILNVHVHADYGIWDWNLLDFFKLLWFHFPTPYKEGDILYDPYTSKRCDCPGPVVMTGITPSEYEKDGRKRTDSSDMNVWGYFQDEETGTLYQEVTWNYMDYEYFPADKLTGKKRILMALSNYIKEEIPLDLFIRAYHLIILEETRNDLMPRGWYTDEGMKLAGLYNPANEKEASLR